MAKNDDEQSNINWNFGCTVAIVTHKHTHTWCVPVLCVRVFVYAFHQHITNVRTLKLICICGLQSVSSVVVVVTNSTSIPPGLPLQKFHFTQWDIFCEIRSILFTLLLFLLFFHFEKEKNENQILPVLYINSICYVTWKDSLVEDNANNINITNNNDDNDYTTH